MKSTTPHCLRAGSSSLKRTSADRRFIDSRTTQALHQLRLHAEELALELAVRLRVLGKSLAASCPGAADERIGGSVTYANLRRQLDGFFGSLDDGEFAGDRSFPVVREYLQVALPLEMNGCVGDESCRIGQVEEVVSLLSEASYEDDVFIGGPKPSFSF